MGGYQSTYEAGSTQAPQPDPTQTQTATVLDSSTTSGRANDPASAAMAPNLQPAAPTAPVNGPPQINQAPPSQSDLDAYQQTQARAQQRNYLQSAIQNESDALQSMQPTSNRGGPIKRLLFSFLSGAGDAMRHDVGLPTTQQLQQQHVANLATLSNAAAMDDLRDAQAQQLQMVPRVLNDGSQVMIPAGHAATFDLAMQRQQQQQNQPSLNDLIGRTVHSAIHAGKDPNVDPVIAQLIQLQRGMGRPPADTAAAQKDAFMQGLQPAIAANEITPPMLTDVRQMVTGIQNSKAIPAAQKPALVSYLIANPTPASQGTQAQVKVNLDNTSKQLPFYDTQNKNSLVYLSPEQLNAGNQVSPGRYTQASQITAGAKTGYAFDPSTNQTVLTNPQEAQQRGFTAFRPVTEANIRNDTHDTKVLNDIAVKSNNLISASAALDQDQGQRNIIAQAITFADKDEQFRLGLWGSQLPTSFLNALGNSGVMRNATPQTRDYVVNLLSLREASMGMQKLLTGSARSSEQQIAALQATLPALEPDSKLARQKMAAFTQNLQMLRAGIPQLPGIDVVPLQGQGNASSTRHFPSMDSIEGQNFQYDPSTDSISPVSGAVDWLKHGGFFQKK